MAPWRREVKAAKSEIDNESAKAVESHFRGPDLETSPTPMLASALCNGGSDLVGEVVSVGATDVAQKP